MSKKQAAIAIYLAIAVAFAIYGTFWGAFAFRGFMYNLGRSLIWPAIMFPAVGQAITAVVILVVVAAVLVFVKRR